jgi:hypothetical protein
MTKMVVEQSQEDPAVAERLRELDISKEPEENSNDQT